MPARKVCIDFKIMHSVPAMSHHSERHARASVHQQTRISAGAIMAHSIRKMSTPSESPVSTDRQIVPSESAETSTASASRSTKGGVKKRRASKGAAAAPATRPNVVAKQSDTAREDPEKTARTVFVGNLPINLTIKELKKTFRDHLMQKTEDATESTSFVESIRFRSLSIAGTAVPTGSSFKLMRKVG